MTGIAPRNARVLGPHVGLPRSIHVGRLRQTVPAIAGGQVNVATGLAVDFDPIVDPGQSRQVDDGPLRSDSLAA